MTAVSRLFCAAAGLMFVQAPGAESVHLRAAQEPRVFRASVDLVTIHAAVRDRRGRLVKGLSAADFEVLDDGEPRSIITLHADGDAPVSLAVLFDVSGSMTIGPKIPLARAVFDALLSQLRPGHDEAALFTFDSALHEEQTFTADPI